MSKEEKPVAEQAALIDEDLANVTGGSTPELLVNTAEANHLMDLEKPGERDLNTLE